MWHPKASLYHIRWGYVGAYVSLGITLFGFYLTPPPHLMVYLGEQVYWLWLWASAGACLLAAIGAVGKIRGLELAALPLLIICLIIYILALVAHPVSALAPDQRAPRGVLIAWVGLMLTLCWSFVGRYLLIRYLLSLPGERRRKGRHEGVET